MAQDLGKYEVKRNDLLIHPFKYLLWRLLLSFIFKITPDFRVLDGLRASLLRICGASIGKKVVIRPSVDVFNPGLIEIGNNSWIGSSVVLYSLDKIKIGNNCCISQHCHINTGTHDYCDESFLLKTGQVIINDEVWVCWGSYINLNVEIGRGAVIGANSNVLRNMPPGMVCAGNPCIPIKKRETKASMEP